MSRLWQGVPDAGEFENNAPCLAPNQKGRLTMPRRKKENVKDKRTPIKVKPIQRKVGGKVTEPWAILERLLKDVHGFDPIRNCRVRLFWQRDGKMDVDGIAVGATVCKANEIDRNLAEESGGETPDIFIKIAEKTWSQLDAKQRERLLFHELCHVHPAKDANGEQKMDSKDRPLWRIGKHPITAFHEELARYGAEMVIGSNQAVLDAAARADAPLLAEGERVASERKAATAGETTPTNPPANAPGNWEGIELCDVPNMPPAALKAFNKATPDPLVTLGDLSAYQAKKGDFWAKDLPGVGPALREKIENAMTEFWASRKADAK